MPSLSRAAAVVGIALFAATPAAHAALEIGKATAMKTTVTGSIDSVTNALKEGDLVFQDEVITTDGSGIGQFEFADHTRLAIGPNARLTLDRFVYDGKASASKVVIGLGKGAFRFVTGDSKHDAYVISTTTATIGVRGTAFDLYVGDNGEMAIAMINGSVKVCNLRHTCRTHGIIGRFLHMTPAGIFSIHSRWQANFFAGTPFAKALPFLANQNALMPALRGSTKAIGRYLGNAGKALEKATKSLPKLFKPPPLPKLRLPKPFN